MQSSSAYVNGATGCKILEFSIQLIQDETVKYNRTIKEVGSCDEGKGIYVYKKCVLVSYMVLPSMYTHALLVNKPSHVGVKRSLDADNCRSRIRND